ncbi:restriction endonuclease subunit S [Enterococcus faecium]|uniref:restriction endonuclease subunit S n=1 Tax=Enterococcus faecium TaxID=1352 RepID=UPI00288D2B6C|nr:restriction endonuclease subunit S [Enterococcus faecium]MDT2368273.1 restriction endonuclease subunit S [Enterococcus faecium]
MSNDIQPEIRFPGFTEAWEQRKLIDLVVRLNKSTNSSRLPKVEFEDIVAGEGRLNKDVSQKFDNRKGIEFLPNDILYGKLRPYLKNWLKATFTGVAIGDFWVFRAKKSDSDFIYSLIQADRYQKAANDTSGTKMPRSDWKKVSGTVFYIPNDLKEQQKIGTFFKQLDDTIALQQRKLDLLKETKKGFLQKMFPKNGAKVPEIRFPGFAEDWEERKLSDGTNKIGDGLHGTPKYSEDGEVYFVNGNNLVNGQIVIMPDTKRVTSNEQSKDDKALNESTILMSINGTIGNLAWYRGENLMLGKSAAYIEVSDFDKKFIYAYLQTRPVKDYYLNSLTGTTIKNLGLKAIRNTNICTPTIDEQAKIGSFFKKLDDTIALHQRKLDLLKETKKGFLQKMFV